MQDICVTIIMKKHPGRPKIGTHNAKAVFFNVRFTPAEARQINAAIRRADQSKSNWIRNALLSASQ